MAFELRYPDESSPTASWLPSKDPLADGSQQLDDDNVLVDVSGDGQSVFTYVVGSAFREYVYRFRGLSVTDKANFETFRAAALGGSFRFREDATCGGVLSYTTVKFAPDGFTRTWQQMTNQRWEMELRLRGVA